MTAEKSLVWCLGDPPVRPVHHETDYLSLDTSASADYVHEPVPSAPTRYTDPRAHELRERYLATFGGDEIPVPVESIAEDLLGLRIEEDDLGECSGMLPARHRLSRHEHHVYLPVLRQPL